MARTRPTVADLSAMKGKRQLTMLRVLTLEEAEAAERAGVDIVSIPPSLILDPRYRDAAPSLFSMPGENFYEIGTADDFVRWAFQMYKASADAVYCSASYATVKAMADENIPVIGHVGSDPVAQDLDRRLQGGRQDGGFGDGDLATPCANTKPRARSAPRSRSCRSRSRRRSAGARRCSCSRWARAPAATRNICSPKTCSASIAATCRATPRSIATSPPNMDRLQNERIAAFREYVDDVDSGAYPEPRHVVRMDARELELFKSQLPK